MDSDHPIKDAPFIPKQLDWNSAVGNLILNFGTLEYLMFFYLEKHLDAKQFLKSKNLHFKNRLKVVADCLEKTGISPGDREAFDRFFRDIETIRELRNHVAHGHFTFDPKREKGRRVRVSLPRDLDRPFNGDCRSLEFNELLDGLKQLAEATELFERLSGIAKK